MELLIIIGTVILATAILTALFCRYHVRHSKRISYVMMLVSPFVATFMVMLCTSVCLEGWRVFTREYWMEAKGGMPIIYGHIATLCVLPALGVAVYYKWWSKRDEKPVV